MKAMKELWQRGYFTQQVELWGYWSAVWEMVVLALTLATVASYFVLMWFVFLQ